ncbi:nucleoside recognition domain-containing protein [Geoalkalibacter subterraneus]|uniref:nucleoside recognition domain-containing protein n=1 Tax=Geoalkalibacter subterraneus TaxID=483547 RepID=UPI000694F8EC|nr:nucleoside recognition domain-containing protein [Geoalkalibacter subterraneus]
MTEESIPDVATRLKTGLSDGWRTSLKLTKWVVPIYLVVDLLKQTPVLDRMGAVFAPLMTTFGLPGETAFAFVAAFTLNLYAAIAILVPLELTSWQITQCGLMMGIAHNLLVEGGVLSSTGARGGLLTLCRLLLAACCGWLMYLVRVLSA